MNVSDPAIRNPSEKRGRCVTDYTADEVARFQEEYRPLATSYRRHARIRGFGMVSSQLSILLGLVLPWPFTMFFWAYGICSFAFFMFARKRLPHCPACRRSPDVGQGVFCSGCGSRALERSHGCFSGGPECRACGKWMSRGRGGRNYKIRFCTHCGLGLDEKGL